MGRRFRKKIIAPGIYNGIEVTAERIKHWGKQAAKMLQKGLLTPCPYYHDKEVKPVRKPVPEDENTKINAGFWDKIWVDKSNVLWGEVEAAHDEGAQAIGKSARQCSLAAMPKWEEGGEQWEDVITHIALTNKAKAPTGDEFVPVVAMSELTPFSVFSLSMLDDEQEFGVGGGELDKDPPAEDDDGAASAGLDSLLPQLAKFGIALPRDTDETNFIERLTTALTALNSQKKEQEGDDLTKQPPGSKTQKPSPIAMSHELQFAADLLKEAGLKNPDTNEPYTVEAIKEKAESKQKKAYVSMSLADQAKVGWAEQESINVLKKRIDACVHDGQITPAYAKKHATPGLEAFSIEFDDNQQRIVQPIERLLEAWEALPKNNVTGQARETLEAFSIDLTGKPDAPLVVHQPPEDAGPYPAAHDYVDMSAEDALKVAQALG